MKLFAVLPLLALGVSAYVVTDKPMDGAVEARHPGSGAVHAVDGLQVRHHKGKGGRGKGIFGRDAEAKPQLNSEAAHETIQTRHHRGKGKGKGKGLFGRDAVPEPEPEVEDAHPAETLQVRHHKGKGGGKGKGALAGLFGN